MSYKIFQKLAITIALLLLQQISYAQQPEKIKLLTTDHRDSTWYKTQRELWRKEVLKDKKNESNWYNYFLASRYAMRGMPWEQYDIEMNKVLKEMNKMIPNSFTYNLGKGWHMGTWDKASIPYLLEAYRQNPENSKVHSELTVRYEVFNEPQKKKEFCEKFYRSNAVSTGFINYNYNVLASLEKNAILFTVGDNDTFPLWILQDALGFRKDVVVLNIGLCGIDDYREQKIKDAGINLSKELLDSLRVGTEVNLLRKKEMENSIVKILAENSDRPVYIGLTAGDCEFKQKVENNLYLVGLASLYSKDRIDNIALLKKNYEQNFLLDYLEIDFFVDESARMVNYCNQNYVTPFLSLYNHYKLSGETQKLEILKKQIEKLARKSQREKEILDLIK